MNISFGSLGSSSKSNNPPPVRRNSIDGEDESASSPASSKSSTSGFSSKLGDYSRSFSGMSKKVTSVASALVMSDEKEKTITPTKTLLEKQKQVEQLVENFRLQCPQTHLGLVVAYSSTTLAPLIDSNIKFKWYRMGDNMEQFRQIDEGPRGWYPPTADDIGKKICANCEDNLDQGFCRYAEAGPIEADPILCSMVETALENGRYEVKDVSVSFGLKAIDPCDLDGMGFNSASSATRGATDGATIGHFNMSNPDRLSSLVSVNSPFFKVTHNISVEVNYEGIFLNGAMFIDEMDASSHRGKRGLRIFSSPKLEITCSLPASIVVTIPITPSPSESLDTPSIPEENTSSPTTDEITSENDTPDPIPVLYEWIGDTHGEIHEAFQDFIQSLPSDATSFRICFACSDRMARDALALTCRSLSSFDKEVGARERLISLPWYSEDGIKHTAKAQTLSGNDLSSRLKTLEEENAALKRQQMELNLQILEHEQNQLLLSNYSNPAPRTVSGDSVPTIETPEENTTERTRSGSVEAKDETLSLQHQQTISQLKTKQRDQEKVISSLKHKEMEYEKTIMDLNSKLKNNQTELEQQSTSISDLKQRVLDSHTELNGLKIVAEKYQLECQDLKEKREKEMGELHSQVSILSIELKDKTARCEKQKEELDELTTSLSEKNQTITQLRDRMLGLKTDLTDQQTLRQHLEQSLQDAKQEVNNLTKLQEEKCEEITTLRQTIQQLTEDNRKLTEELAQLVQHKIELETRSISRQDFDDLEEKCHTIEGEKNHYQQRADSLGKELKKVMKSSQQEVVQLRTELDGQKDSNQRLQAQFDELKEQMESDAKKRQEEEAQKSKGLFSRRKKDPA